MRPLCTAENKRDENERLLIHDNVTMFLSFLSLHMFSLQFSQHLLTDSKYLSSGCDFTFKGRVALTVCDTPKPGLHSNGLCRACMESEVKPKSLQEKQRGAETTTEKKEANWACQMCRAGGVLWGCRTGSKGLKV